MIEKTKQGIFVTSRYTCMFTSQVSK